MRLRSCTFARLSATVALLTYACAPYAANDAGTPGLSLSVTPTQASAGSVVTIRLTNETQHEVGYNLCGALLDRQVGGEWQEHPERPAEVCTMELRVLQPGASGTFDHTLPSGLPAGTYRFRAGVEYPLGEGNVGVASGAVQVGR